MTTSPIEHPSRPIVRWLLALWGLTLVAGTLVFLLPDALASANRVSGDRAVFTAANVATLTGFSQQFAKPDDFGLAVRIVFFVQLLAGSLLSLVGGGVLLKRAIGSRHSERAVALAGVSLIVVASALGLLFAEPQQDAMSAMSRGLGALAGSGLVFGPTPTPASGPLQMLWGPLSVAGLLGVVVLLDLWRAVTPQNRLTPHAGVVLSITAARYLAVLLPAVFLILATAGSVGGGDWLRASALALTATGFGLPVESLTSFPRGLDAVVLVLLLVGPGTLSTAGGLGFAWLATGPSRFRRAIVVGLTVQLAAMLCGYVILAQSEPQLAPDRLALLVVGAATNVGLSHEPVSITGNGLFVLSALMVFGRVFPLLVIGLAMRDQGNVPLARRVETNCT